MQRQREHWESRLGFILAAAGSAIGLGTLWKFPYVTGANGGGIFVIFYLICTLFIGIPLFIGELLLGRKAQRGPVGIFVTLSSEATGWKSIGWLGVVSSFLILSYYIVVAGWGLNYLLLSLNQFTLDRSAFEIVDVFNTLNQSGDITLFWAFIFLLMTFGVVFQGIRQGIEKWSKVFTTSLLVILVILFLYSVTLDGFGEAVHFLFAFNVTKFRPSAFLEALGLSFFTLSLGQGVLLTYGSYLRKIDDIPKIAMIVGGMVIVVSFLAGMMIFPVIFTFNLPPQGGEGLVFKTLPVLFAKLPGSMVISTVFFALFVFTAFTSAVALLEAVVANLIDLYGWSRKKAVCLVSFVVFIVGIPSALSGGGEIFKKWLPMYGKTFFESIDSLVSIWLLPMGGLLLSLYIGWAIKTSVLKEAFSEGSRWQAIFYVWLFLVRWLAPIAIILILLQKGGLINVDSFFIQ
ncbi:MAG: sodium-dependent transporter [Chlamydiia bacterium]|nr:sodium-dependent transporter [Chlamydiia bacterium]